MKETNLRSLTKSISYRIFGTLITFVITFIITNEIIISSSIALLDLLSKIVLYWYHERMWLKINWGYEENKLSKKFKILICGLPGAGKTTLSEQLVPILSEKYQIEWFNADKVRTEFNDWDFSEEGRKRQAQRMSDLCTEEKIYIADFVAPTEKLRKLFNPNFIIWLNTIEKSRFENTNNIFEKPQKIDLKIDNYNYDIKLIIEQINKSYDRN